ncbi:MAG TPA: DoxX family protein [Vicinamibacterales bacterium]|nr:DoxX family protein [Vicinamibacterales bacterium]
MKRLSSILFVVLRVVAGLLFACHGVQKLFGLLGGHRVVLQSRLGAAGIIELTCGILIASGIPVVTPVAALLATAEMAFAYSTVHVHRGLWPIQNGGELALLYGSIFLYIAARGGRAA